MGNEQDNNGNGDNPKWRPILDVLPPEFHSLIKPKLKEWDAGVTRRFQEIHAEYEPLTQYKEFVDNEIDLDYARNAIILADKLQSDPAGTIQQINEGWGLGFVSKEEAEKLQQQQATNNDDPANDEFDLGDGEFDLTKHPQFKAVQEMLTNMQSEAQKNREREEQERALEEFEASLDSLEQKYTDPSREGGPLPFNRLFVTALIQQGLNGEDAVKAYHEALAGNAVTQTTDNNGSEQDSPNGAPVVMGGNGSGSGTPNEPINMGELSKNDTNKLVEDLLRQAAESGN